MEFITVAREIERLSYLLTYNKEEDFFYDIKGTPMLYNEQWDELSEMLKELTIEEREMFLDLLAGVCPEEVRNV
jgi:hypothetical protein